LTNFHNISPVDSVTNLLLSSMHITPIVSLLYLVKHKSPKTNIFYRSVDGLVVNLTEMLNMSYSKCKEQWRTY